MQLNRLERAKLSQFIKKNFDRFGLGAQQFWEEEFIPGNDYPYGFVHQIYLYLFPQKFNDELYQVFIDFLISKFPNLSSYQIIEVASGYIPAISLLLMQKLSIENDITCFDPQAFPLHIPKINIKQKEFTANTNTKGADLLIAHCPCEALDAIVEKTIATQNEMCVQTCPCGHDLNPFFGYRAFDYYIDYLIERLSVLEDRGFLVECDYTKSYDTTNAPVLTVRKRTK